MASVLDTKKAKRRLKYAYLLLIIMIVVGSVWLICLIARLVEGVSFTVSDGVTCAVLVLGVINSILVVVNVRRVAAGKHPL